MRVKIDGAWAASFAHVGGITWSDRYGDGACGPDQASFTLAVDRGNDASWLRLGRDVEVYDDGGLLVFGGRISEMGRDYPRTIHAKGWAKYVEGESTVVGHKFGRDAYNRTFTPTDPTVVSWLLDASALDIGVADDGLYTRVTITYVASLDGEGNPVTDTATVDDAVAQDLYGVITYEMDATDLGIMLESAAEDLAQAQLDQFTVPQWLSRVAATGQILFTPGGHPANVQDVRAGQMVELFNVPNNLGGIRNQLNQRVILGETEHSDENPLEVAIAPTRLAVRSLLDALKQNARAAA